MSRRFVAIAAAALLAIPAFAAEPETPPSPTSPSAQELAGAIRGLLLNHLPDPLTTGEPGWGKQVHALVDPNQMRNHGAWRKYRVVALNPAKTLIVEVHHVKQPDASRTTFDLLVGFDTEFDFEQQIWRRGLRLYSGSTKARAKVWAALACEATFKVETTKFWLPDLVIRLRVTKAELRYSGLEVVHIAGVGGDGAKLLGEALKETIKQVKPSLEKELLEKAGAALIKAGDTKEVRVSMSKLLKSGGK
jgi:hypothetical protein